MQREIRQRQYQVSDTYDTDITLKRQSILFTEKRVNMEMFFTEARTMPDVLREVLPKVSQS
jgi:hypothetical protein